MESEIELHETIQELRQVSTCPDLYPTMVELNVVPSLLELLSHENTDVAVGIVTLLQDLTDMENFDETVDSVESLINALVDQQVFALLVQNIERLDETVKEESDGVHNTLGRKFLLSFKGQKYSEIIKIPLKNLKCPFKNKIMLKELNYP